MQIIEIVFFMIHIDNWDVSCKNVSCMQILTCPGWVRIGGFPCNKGASGLWSEHHLLASGSTSGPAGRSYCLTWDTNTVKCAWVHLQLRAACVSRKKKKTQWCSESSHTFLWLHSYKDAIENWACPISCNNKPVINQISHNKWFFCSVQYEHIFSSSH